MFGLAFQLVSTCPLLKKMALQAKTMTVESFHYHEASNFVAKLFSVLLRAGIHWFCNQCSIPAHGLRPQNSEHFSKFELAAVMDLEA
jgi:hypothetical protein